MTRWPSTDDSGNRVPSATRRSSASSTPRTNATTARVAKPADASWLIGRFPVFSKTTGPPRCNETEQIDAAAVEICRFVLIGHKSDGLLCHVCKVLYMTLNAR